MPKNVMEWDRRRSGSVSMSDYHRWVIKRLADEAKARDRSQILCRLVEAEADKRGWTVDDYLRGTR